MPIANIDEADPRTIPRIDAIRCTVFQRPGGPNLDKSGRGETEWPGWPITRT